MRKGYEALVMARVGALWASQGMVAREGPAHVSVPYCSYGASQQLLTGICAALHERERSGTGQHVEATLVNGLASLGTWNWYLNVITSKFPDAFTPSSPFGAHGLPLSPMIFMLLIALSKDGRWLQFSQVQLHLYMAMLKVFGLDWMLQDEEWKDAVWAADTPRTGEFWDKLFEAVQSKNAGASGTRSSRTTTTCGPRRCDGAASCSTIPRCSISAPSSRSTTPSGARCASRGRSSRCSTHPPCSTGVPRRSTRTEPCCGRRPGSRPARRTW